MYYFLYNEKSNHGKSIKMAMKYVKKFNKKGISSEIVNLLTINERDFLYRLNADDAVVLIGGDGTYHQFFNHIYPLKPKCRVFALSCGRGNDFARDYKKKKMFEITHLINDLPTININDRESYLFVNGVGMGVDSMVCQYQMDNAINNKRESYFKIALRVFKKFKPYSLDISVDGVDYHFDHVWFFVCNNGKYFGGGMKITPKAIREDDHLNICVVNKAKLWKLILIFPSIFLGIHTFFGRKYITMLKGKNITVNNIECDILQRDGEVSYNVNKITIER